MGQELSAIHPGRDAAGDRQVLQVIWSGPNVDRNELGKEYRDSPDCVQHAAWAYMHVKKKERLTSFLCNCVNVTSYKCKNRIADTQNLVEEREGEDGSI